MKELALIIALDIIAVLTVAWFILGTQKDFLSGALFALASLGTILLTITAGALTANLLLRSSENREK